MLNKKVEGKAVLQLLCLKSLLLLEKFSLKTKFNIIHEQIGRNKWDLKNQEGDFLYFDNLKSPVKIERVSMSVNYSKPFFSTKNQLFHYSWFPEICQLQLLLSKSFCVWKILYREIPSYARVVFYTLLLRWGKPEHKHSIWSEALWWRCCFWLVAQNKSQLTFTLLTTTL